MEQKRILLYLFLRGLEIFILAGGLGVDDNGSSRCVISVYVVWDKEESLRCTSIALVEM
jgi:hypothetical protein